jgi:hypothetical protein
MQRLPDTLYEPHTNHDPLCLPACLLRSSHHEEYDDGKVPFIVI